MGLFLRQQESRSKLQSRLDKELKGKLKQKTTVDQPEVEPQFLDDNHQTTNTGMVIIVIVALLIVGAIIWFILNN